MGIALDDFGGSEVARVTEEVNDVLVEVVLPVLEGMSCGRVVLACAVLLVRQYMDVRCV